MPSSYMQQALTLAKRAVGNTHPNPMVGAVIVRDGQVVGRGYHHRAGTAHAEVLALAQARDAARGASLYVTLEPCRHTGRTPPCTEAIMAAGIREVVYALPDPNPRAAGGARDLAAAGITVHAGDGAREALAQNVGYLSWVVRQRPWVLLKSAMSADGKVATVTGASRYLTGDAALDDVHRLRARCDAILVGIGTALADDPALTCRRGRRRRDPVRVVLDTHGRLPPAAQVLNLAPPSAAPTLIYTGEHVSSEYERGVFARGGEVIQVEEAADGRLSLPAVLRDLGERGLYTILVEGGPTIHSAFIAAGLADAWRGYLAPLVLGGPALGPVGGTGWPTLAQAPRLTEPTVRRVGRDAVYHAYFESSWRELAAACLPD